PGEVVYSDALFVAERIDNGVRHSLKEERRYPHDLYSRERLFVDNYIPVNTFAWPRAVAAEVGEFDETLSGLEDWDFLLRLAARLPFHHLQRETVQVRMRVSDAAPDRRSQQAFKDYPALYRELYSRHSDLDDAQVKRQRAAKLKQLGQAPSVSPGDLVRAWLAARRPNPVQRRLIDQYLESNQDGPRIGVVILDLLGDADAITRTLGSLQEEQQGYRNLQVRALTVGDFAEDSALLVKIERDGYIEALNLAVAGMDSDWCVLVRAGECFTASGLLIAALELIAAPQCRAIYADEIQVAANGEPQAVLRPDFNLDLLLSFPASMARHWLFRRDVFIEAGGFGAEYGQALEFELVLRLIEQGGLEGLGHVSEPLVISAALQLEDNADERRAIERHLNARGYAEARVEALQPGRYRLRYGHAGQPGVSIVVPALAPLAKLQRCVESILESTLDVPYEILLLARDNPDEELNAWLQGLRGLGEANLRILDQRTGDTLAAAQNFAGREARGDYLLFLAADTAVVQGDWLAGLLDHAQRPEVGPVGAKLLSPEGTIRHAGLILG
ncbi:MAG TPA: glycosyltransferase, partial [Pseudomonas sp.]|nr:glycosyltransferase [Pseudomonas sp.]